MKSLMGMAIIFFSVFSGACHNTDKETNKTYNYFEKMNSDNTEIFYLALGDSYTIGESVDEQLRWPVQLVERLRKDNVNINDAEIIARTGWTTDELLRAVEAAEPGNDYDLVSLLIGVNNQYRGRDLSNFREELTELIGIAVRSADSVASRVIVLSIPDWGVMPFAAGKDRDLIAGEIDAFNAVVREECSYAGVKFYDITAISRKAANDPSLVAGDGLHPSGKMYSMWVDLVYNDVYQLLK